MSEDFENSLARLKEIFHQLFDGEPSPDEEEEAQKEMLTLFGDLISQCEDAELKPLLEETLEIVKNWDTLDKWFKEVPELVENIQKIIKQFEKKPEIEEIKSSGEDTSSKLTEEENLELGKEIAEAIGSATKNIPTGIDLSIVIKTVTEQVTKSFMDRREKGVIKEIEPQLEKIETETKDTAVDIKQNEAISDKKSEIEKSSETSEKKGISKADIMKSLLETATKRAKSLSEIQTEKAEKSESEQEEASKPKRTKLTPPKITIPPVIKPIKKITPDYENKTSSIEELSSESVVKEEPVIKEVPEDKAESGKIPEVPQIQPIRRIKTTNIDVPKPKKIMIPTPKKVIIKPKSTGQSSNQENKVIVNPIESENNNREKIAKKPLIQPVNLQKPSLQPVNSTQPSIQPNKMEQKAKNDAPQVKAVSTRPKIVKPRLSVKASTVNSNQQPTIKPMSSNIPVIKPVDIPTKTTQEDLFDAFTRRPESNQQKSQIGGITAVNITNSDNLGSSISRIGGQDDFGFAPEESSSTPLSKDKLYQELIALEGRKYAIERGRKEMRTRHEKGQIQDVEYKTAIERFKYELETISGKINDIRQKIQAL